MRRYETIFILNPDLVKEQTLSVTQKIKGIITQNDGEIIKSEDWGKRKLAYDVKKKPRGHYILTTFSGSPALLSELHRDFRVMDAVIKFQSVRLDERVEAAAKSSVAEELTEEESQAEAPKGA